MFFKIGVVKNFANFTGKPLPLNFLVIKMKVLNPATLFIKVLKHRLVPVKLVFVLYLFQQTKTCLKSAIKTLEISEKITQKRTYSGK